MISATKYVIIFDNLNEQNKTKQNKIKIPIELCLFDNIYVIEIEKSM